MLRHEGNHRRPDSCDSGSLVAGVRTKRCGIERLADEALPEPRVVVIQGAFAGPQNVNGTITVFNAGGVIAGVTGVQFDFTRIVSQ